MTTITEWMIATIDPDKGHWIVPTSQGKVEIKAGRKIRVECANFQLKVADVHLGGMLRGTVPIEELRAHARPAQPNELRSEYRRCPHCDRVETFPGRWVSPPPCYSPRGNVVLVPHICPECDHQKA